MQGCWFHTNTCSFNLACVFSQVGFFNIVGIPLFKAMVSLFPNAQPILDGALVNYREWEKAAQATS